MKNTVREMLKEMLLLQSAGGYDMFDNLISMTIDMHCTLNELDKEQFVQKLESLKHLVWDKCQLHILEEHERSQQIYATMLEHFLEVKNDGNT